MKNIFKILMFTFIIFTGSEFVKKNEASACTVTAGVIQAASISGGCDTEPDSYTITIYDMYLCTAAPTAPTTSASIGLGNCERAFESSSGTTVTVSTSGNVAVTGTFTKPPNGSYTHGVIRLDNTFGLTAAMEFSTSQTGRAGGSGVFCATNEGSGTNGTGGYTGNSTTCGATAQTAGTWTETLNTFDSTFDATVSVSNVNGSGDDIAAYLINSSGNLAASEITVDRLDGVATFANPVVFDDNTSQIELSFNVSSGMAVDDDSSTLNIGSGPFQVQIITR